MILKTDFQHRTEMIDYLRESFPVAASLAPEVSELHGGREAAQSLLQTINPERYAATRNHLKGAVTKLSAYLRHGVLTLAEVRRLALQRGGAKAEKLVQELAWREYWQRVYERIGDGVWKDRESYKTGWRPADYQSKLPDDLAAGATGLRCMDSFAEELRTTGYLHNHARMWMAAYVIHFRRVRWQAGAAWFLTHLRSAAPDEWVNAVFGAFFASTC